MLLVARIACCFVDYALVGCVFCVVTVFLSALNADRALLVGGLGLIRLAGLIVYNQAYCSGEPAKRRRGAFGYIGLIGMLFIAIEARSVLLLFLVVETFHREARIPELPAFVASGLTQQYAFVNAWPCRRLPSWPRWSNRTSKVLPSAAQCTSSSRPIDVRTTTG